MRARSLVAPFLLAALAASVALSPSASATTNHTIVIDGHCSDWDPDEKLPVRDGAQTWITWDSTALYFAFLGGADATQRRIVALDVDPGTDDGVASISYSGVTFGISTAIPEYLVEVTSGTVYFNVRSGVTWTQTINPAGISATFSTADATCKIGTNVTNVVELAVPRASLVGAVGPASLPTNLPIGVSSFFFDPSSSFVYGSPAFNGSNFGACAPSGNAPQSFFAAESFASTDLARAPSTFGVPLSATHTSLTSGTNPSTFGQTVTLTASVTRNSCDPALPIGTVAFFDGATPLGTSNVTTATGQASLDVSTLAGGTHALAAVYSGDNNFGRSTSSVVTQTVGAAPTTTSLSSSSNPSTFGAKVTFTAAVTSTGGTPSGSVDFFDGTSPLGGSTLDGTGKGSFALTTLSPGSHTITAKYEGATSFAAGTSNAVTQVVNPTGATAAVTSSANPSIFGASVDFTATVTGIGGVTPTGSVSFLDGSTPLGSKTLGSSATAVFTTASLTAGAHVITATYGGDSHYATASGQVSQTVNVAPTTTALLVAPGEIAFGASSTLSATVTSTAPGTPTGKITFQDGSTTIQSVDVDGAGKASLVYTPANRGARMITASYGGDVTFAVSTSPTATLTVDDGPSTTTLAITPSPAAAGDVVTMTATVTTTAPVSLDGNTIEFDEGTTPVGQAVLSGGKAVATTSSLGVGTHSIVAHFQGASGVAPSASDPVDETITGAGDASPEAGAPDASSSDGAVEAGDTGAITEDASRPDTSSDAGVDASPPGGDASSSSGGCGCRVEGSSSSRAAPFALLALAALALRKRARR